MNEKNDQIPLQNHHAAATTIEEAKNKLCDLAKQVIDKIEQIEGRTLQLTTDKRRLFPPHEKYQIYKALDEVVDLIVEHLQSVNPLG